MAIDDGNTNGYATLPELRAMLLDARQSDDAERIHLVLIEVVERLIDHAEAQAEAIALMGGGAVEQ